MLFLEGEKQMRETTKEDAIAAIADCTDTLNRCIEQAHGLGLNTKVIVEAYMDIRVEVTEDEDI